MDARVAVRVLARAMVLGMVLAAGSASFAQPVPATATSPAGLLPPGFVLVHETRGDLNRDDQVDHVLIVRGTDKAKFFAHEQRGQLDRNRRGILVAFGDGGRYALAVANLDCFSSENEDGGVYYPPELSVAIRRGTLVLHYAHGRYGYWTYTFRYQDGDFELIGFDRSENRGPVVERSVSMNFITRKMRIRTYLDRDAVEGSSERFKETWASFPVPQRVLLRKIGDFDELLVDRMFAPAR